MPSRTEPITPALLRGWPLPTPASSKYSRGQVVVVGGARRTPGAALLAGVAALRVGAGRLTLGVARSVAVPLAVRVPEAGVVELPETEDGCPDGTGLDRLEADLRGADAVLVGPGLDDADRTVDLLRAVAPVLPRRTPVVLDAFALGVLPRVDDVAQRLAGRLVLTPNLTEAALLLGVDEADEGAGARIARQYGAVVTCQGRVSAPDGSQWAVSTGMSGLATSGSGDVLAGATLGVVARGADLAQAVCWATHLHAAAGDRLATRVGRLGYLARELPDELPALLAELAP
ncbi:NAD(P)H-hydrate dehydratase [Cellulomonas fimi]|uniref:ADP-dependent (S)-NAD(P)H-hydrate dehydratase n=1 Tax=Cellulomonas fimi (strain ATCC 484 / DSM 20113 / JCM 1341 / CCUG 24087 / LMG 16345 / NBRC 15513 / NCIMB 8980 / NCTC 7547 / NRS-133) TaxID=590998 RepID=F4H0W7_CELFA|nr:NAD(P)H-hydrate dehydratase [Cellulomonas fimi]AEE46214.1 carbohydrate kinase, YjeF related protein [Cellulomonas fimi ATCC 484]VEH32084.1 Nicotinamide nucleotide repair protein [Cellulomonas fimi]